MDKMQYVKKLKDPVQYTKTATDPTHTNTKKKNVFTNLQLVMTFWIIWQYECNYSEQVLLSLPVVMLHLNITIHDNKRDKIDKEARKPFKTTKQKTPTHFFTLNPNIQILKRDYTLPGQLKQRTIPGKKWNGCHNKAECISVPMAVVVGCVICLYTIKASQSVCQSIDFCVQWVHKESTCPVFALHDVHKVFLLHA